MQNLTANFNILYNANELVDESERNIQFVTVDDYERLISVYKEPLEATAQGEIKNLDQAILKANVIANEKSLSSYVDDAYFLIAKANHLKANFYNASEFFTYVYKSYPDEKELRQAALAWKARSLIQSERYEEAESTLDTALKYIETEKESVADIFATRAQLHLYAQEDEQAIKLLEQAIKFARNRQNKIRWIYLLAQLQQVNKNMEDAYDNYTEVVKSNAPFDMAFNANLSRIGIRDEQSGNKVSRSQRLSSLLKDDKNRDFIDQIYFQIANTYAQDKKLAQAIENYNSSIKNSTKNITQKGLSYQKLAEIYFDQSDFVRAKVYYDSTLSVLPKTYPGFALISKKAENLELLADRLTTISQQDTLQMLASLPEAERDLRIGVLVREQSLKAMNSTANTANSSLPGPTQALANSVREGKFYFSNSVALNQGLIDFKRRWGSRKLEDNWRRSQKSASDVTSAVSPDQAITNNPFQQPGPDATAANIETIRRTFIEGVPLSSEQKLISDQKIASAFYDIGNYYRDVSLDTAQALSTYEKLLKRFPENSNKLAVYYNLYRLNLSIDPQRSEEFKNILLKDFADSPFAKTILDPQYNQRSDEQEIAFNRFYNDAYDLYLDKKYSGVLTHINSYGTKFTGRALPAQLDYLRSLAVGRTQKLPELEKAFKELINAYPEDKLIVPLVKEHLDFINSNRLMLSERVVALVDNDPARDRFVQEPIIQNIPAVSPTAIISEPRPVSNTDALNPVVNSPVVEAGFFVKEEAALFYFVVNISDPVVNLSSSRFGIGQFNRINLPQAVVKHQLKNVNRENQLIFVGPFEGRDAAQNYFNSINPMIKEIMKIPASKYSTFFINQQNLDKISDRALLDRYVEFYKSNYE
ncbi:tetratricopeptide repeat protein [Daejeonella sp.]|uniref:type IX secretion system periplasmic lipoprotein PorW/SprE n=1 Tax=Daejeonella sp. TaxID=2805397 RepID=UPI00398317FC